MTNITEILPDLFVVEVPIDANKFEKQFLFNDFYELVVDNDDWDDPLYFRLKTDNNNAHDFEILGTCTKDEISFDVSELVEVCEELSYWDSVNDIFYKNYSVDEEMPMIGFNRKEASFRSLLLSKGIKEFEKLVVIKKI